MLPRKNRITKALVDQIFKKGRFLNSPTLTFRFIEGGTRSYPAISFIAPKSVSKSAVKRNTLRRKGYASLKNYIANFPPHLIGVFVFRKYEDDSKIIKNEIENILHKIN